MSKAFKSIIGDKGNDQGTLVKDFTSRLRHVDVHYLFIQAKSHDREYDKTLVYNLQQD